MEADNQAEAAEQRNGLGVVFGLRTHLANAGVQAFAQIGVVVVILRPLCVLFCRVSLTM